MNKFQTLAKNTYAGGQFNYLSTDAQTDRLGDSLFAFIMRELSEAGGCNDHQEAVHRMENARNEIDMLLTELKARPTDRRF